MGTNSKLFLGALIGAGIGWIVGEILADQFAPEYYTEEELKEMKEALTELQYGDTPDGEPKIVVNKQTGDDRESVIPYSQFYQKEHKLVMKTLEELEPTTLEETVEESDIAMDEEADVIEEEETIFLLNDDEFAANELGFKQVTLLYYPEDDVLTDDKYRPVQRVEKLIGEEALVNFGVLVNDDDTVFVRNMDMKVEYKILNTWASYNETILNGGKPSKKKDAKTKKVNNIFEEMAEEEKKEEDAEKESNNE